LEWTDDLRLDRALAEGPFYRHFSYRDMAKRGGHATNYYGQPLTVGRELKVPTEVIASFQRNYFQRFPELQDWHMRVIAQIQQTGTITTALQRQRRFWGRTDDAATWRKAIAFDPQSLVADVMNEGLYQVQAFLLRECKDAKSFVGRKTKQQRALCPLRGDLRAQVHDAGVFLVPIEALSELAPKIQKQLEYPVDFGNLGTMVIPSDMTVGKRWCKYKPKPILKEGLRDYTPGQQLHW
jgi:DNA polymerase I-like protein with 3'-5' exonuclease and polymerase domains